MAVGRPISLTPNVATKTLSSTATADQTSFTVTGGYRINELGVYRNGVRLVQGKDFTASDGSTVTLLSGATVDDIIDFVIFDSFNVADAINSVGDQTIDGELTATKFIGDGGGLTGVGTANINTNNIQVSGITTLGTETTVVGSAVTFTASGGTIVGVLTATSFSGDISNTTGIQTAYIDAASLTVAGIATFNGVGNFDAEVTAAGGVDVTGGVKSAGIVSFTNTTASTSTTTGAVIVSGGVGIAGSLHVGENVSVGGTLTYEDVTNIDSVGLITAQAGLNVSGGPITVGSGITVAQAGVVTFADGGANSNALHFGSRGDFQIYHNGSFNYIVGDSSNPAHIYIRPNAGEEAVCIENNGACKFAYDNSYKFQTTNDGTSTTGISTADDFVIGVGGTSVHTALGTKASTGKAIAMAMVFG